MVDCRRAVEAAEELAAESEKPALKLEVGKKYVMRNGTVTDPLEDSNGYTHCGTSYPFRDPKSCNTYQESGRYSVTTEDREDLVEEYVEPGPPTEGPAVCTFNLEPEEDSPDVKLGDLVKLKSKPGTLIVVGTVCNRNGKLVEFCVSTRPSGHPAAIVQDVPAADVEWVPGFKVGHRVNLVQTWRSSHTYTVVEVAEWKTDVKLDVPVDGQAWFHVDELKLASTDPEFDWSAVPAAEPVPPAIRTFETGATRNLDTNKLDYEGFLSPLVLHSFAKYMHSHRLQKDGTMRDSDNWQRGISQEVYMKSMWRHFMDVWMLHRGQIHPVSPDSGEPVSLEEALCAVLFNVQGMLHEHLKGRA